MRRKVELLAQLSRAARPQSNKRKLCKIKQIRGIGLGHTNTPPHPHTQTHTHTHTIYHFSLSLSAMGKHLNTNNVLKEINNKIHSRFTSFSYIPIDMVGNKQGQIRKHMTQMARPGLKGSGFNPQSRQEKVENVFYCFQVIALELMCLPLKI